MSNSLTALQKRIVDLLVPNKDVSVMALFDAAWPQGDQGDLLRQERDLDNRTMQQALGPVISRINEKLKRGRIEPGERKQTYRLNTKIKV